MVLSACRDLIRGARLLIIGRYSAYASRIPITYVAYVGYPNSDPSKPNASLISLQEPFGDSCRRDLVPPE